MSDQKTSNVFSFPGKRPESRTSTVQSVASAFEEVLKAIPEDAVKTKRPRAKAISSQSIEGDNNNQVGSAKVIRQTIKGSGNVQIGGHVENLTIHTIKSMRPSPTGPAPDTIGANGLLKERINEAFGRVGKEREKRFGKSAYSTMYAKFKTDFAIPANLAWTTIWSWPVNRAEEICKYLEGKFGNTISGRIVGAAKKPGYKHSTPQLFAKEKVLLNHLGLEPGDLVVKAEMHRLFGTDTHKNLDPRQHANWVAHLELQVDRIYEPKN